jgi:hypothetical protein
VKSVNPPTMEPDTMPGHGLKMNVLMAIRRSNAPRLRAMRRARATLV